MTAQVKVGRYGDNPVVDKLPRRFQLTLRINGTAQGPVGFDSDSLQGELNPAQTQALLAALTRKSNIEFVRGGIAWALSDTGATAVLLKMDEFQGRLRTPGALIRRGTEPESKALPPLLGLVIKPGTITPARPGDKSWVKQQGSALLNALGATLSGSLVFRNVKKGCRMNHDDISRAIYAALESALSGAEKPTQRTPTKGQSNLMRVSFQDVRIARVVLEPDRPRRRKAR